jgi:lipopolysaccharide transport system ATP-binding protein
MGNYAIRIEKLSKVYNIVHNQRRSGPRYRTLANDITDLLAGLFRRHSQSQRESIYALKEIDLEVQKGEAVGIIGRNGAGKSTLLKILSRIIEPTSGRAEVYGRVASLLEVGTGFHPELTGKENIFLNGTILGMRCSEIERKFDEIVAFAEVEKFIDTPVKHYSSGMYIRLAFAVAAHLEAEILLIDEVLAVGDAEFQKKCLGKMGEVAKGGRTVLFVSHSMTSINHLCRSAILLEGGRLIAQGPASSVTARYLYDCNMLLTSWTGPAGDEQVQLLETCVQPVDADNFYTDAPVEVSVRFNVQTRLRNLVAGFRLYSQYGYELAYVLRDDYATDLPEVTEPGEYRQRFIIPAFTLAKGIYEIQWDFGIHSQKAIIINEGRLKFEMFSRTRYGCRYSVEQKGYQSLFRPRWSINKS